MTKGLSNSTVAEKEETAKIKSLFEQYVKEMIYLRNFSQHTIKGCWRVFTRWIKYVGEMPTEMNLSQFVIEMRQHNLNTTTCNISIIAFNSFLTWMKEKNHCPQTFSNGKPFKIAKLPAEKRQLKVFDDSEIKKILSFRPKYKNEHRIYALVSLLIETGIRINEALTLDVNNVDLDNLIIKVYGKGKKERIVTVSFELRKVLHRYLNNYRQSKLESKFFFCTATGTALMYRNAERDFLKMLNKVGVSKDNIDHCFHSFRRKYARNFIKNGGNVLYLSQAMGHSSLQMTSHYVSTIDIEEMQIMQNKTSLMSRLK